MWQTHATNGVPVGTPNDSNLEKASRALTPSKCVIGRRAVAGGRAGRTAYATLQRLLMTLRRREATTKLQSSGLPTGTLFAEHVRACRALAVTVMSGTNYWKFTWGAFSSSAHSISMSPKFLSLHTGRPKARRRYGVG